MYTKYIEWKDEFSLGIPDIDYEHRNLIELINESLVHASENPDESINLYLGEIYTAIASHFALEEKFMQEHKYDQYLDHKHDHDRLLDEIRDIMDAYEATHSFDEDEFGMQLTLWFTEHFSTKDARLHKYLID